MTPNSSHLGDSLCCAEIQVNRIDTTGSAVENKPQVWPMVRLVLQNRKMLSYQLCKLILLCALCC